MDAHIKQLLSLGREHYERNEYSEAEYLLRQVVAKTDRYADVFNMLGVIAHSQGQFARAQEYFERAVHLNPSYTEAQLNLMVAYNEVGRYDDARRIYAKVRGEGRERGSKIDPFAKGKIANMHADVSNAYRDAGMLSGAVRELEKAVELCPNFADLRTRLAALYRDMGKTSEAIEQLEQAKAINPGYHQARVSLAAVLLSSGDKDRAIEELWSVIEDDPDNQPARMYLKAATAQDKSEESDSGEASRPGGKPEAAAASKLQAGAQADAKPTAAPDPGASGASGPAAEPAGGPVPQTASDSARGTSPESETKPDS